MELLRVITEKDLGIEHDGNENDRYRFRKNVRAIVLNAQNEILLIHLKNRNYHELPGGGMDNIDADVKEALKRELQEEAGITIEVRDEIGTVLTVEHQVARIQLSFCYIAAVTSKTNSTALTEYEKSADSVTKWVELDKAIELLQKDNPTKDGGKAWYLFQFFRKRDLAFLNKAKEVLR